MLGEILLLNIVLYQPRIPQNTGNVARSCFVTGSRLHLVGPMGFRIDEAKLRRAGLTYWHQTDIVSYDSWDEFLEKIVDGRMILMTSHAKNSTRILPFKMAIISFLGVRMLVYRKRCMLRLKRTSFVFR